MNDNLTPSQFASPRRRRLRVLGDGANAYFRTGSYAAGARLVQAISELPGVNDQRPNRLRHDGVHSAPPQDQRRLRRDDPRQSSSWPRDLGAAESSASPQIRRRAEPLVIPGATDAPE